ncbi:MAG: PQQ-binding-like beta-propeller repeat protein [Dysgonamonadaceae bacterium]|jgi:outer membrane protein assembly factor BamB|nr:PQQ-binding-like beta-propeller repeat protein [Dysgonamonadaceae bacterium]
MNKKIARNIAIVTAIFIVVVAIMLITNYFQIRGFNPLQTEVIETLKEINYENSQNTKLQEQIRQLDLLARRAYFVRMEHLKTGVYLLVAMLMIFIISARYYFEGVKNLPAKEIDTIDEWADKTLARKYVNRVACVFVAAALVFAFLSSPYLKSVKVDKETGKQVDEGTGEQVDEGTGEQIDENEIASSLAMNGKTDEKGNEQPPSTSKIENPEPETRNSKSTNSDTIEQSNSDTIDIPKPQTPTLEIPKVTHTSFRGNNSSGITAAKNIPTEWNLTNDENIAWKVDIAKHGYNSPVISGNKVFITGADEQARELYCYDLNTGELLWKHAADDISGSPAQMPATSEDTGLAASTVTANGKQVCAIFATGDLICTDMDGKRLWAKNLGVPENHYGYASSLLTFGNLLIIQYDNSNSPKILALDMATGTTKWEKSRTDKITWSSPVIAYINRKPQLLLMGNPSISSYNPNNGEKNWSVNFLSGEVASSPCSANGLVFGASEYSSLIAIDAVKGEKLWDANDYLPEVSSPVATKENVYVATSYGVVACYDAKTGELKKALETDTEFYSSPIIAEGKIYLFSNSGKAFIYSANSELTLINSFETGQRTFATPAFTDNRMIVRSESQLYCVTQK